MHRAVTVRAPVREGCLPLLRTALEAAAGEAATRDFTPATIPGVHFARLSILPEAPALPGGGVGDSLLYMADVDHSVNHHLLQLSRHVPDLVDGVFAYCDGYPPKPDAQTRFAWLRAHHISSAATYVNTVGIGAQQVVQEAALYRWLEDYLDSQRTEMVAMAPAAIHRAIRAAVADDPVVRFALRPARGLPVIDRLQRVLTTICIVALLLVTLPATILVAVPWLIAIRRLEQSDPVSRERPDPASIARLRNREDQFACNAFAAAGQVKMGSLRRLTVRVLLLVIDLGVTYFFARGSLAGVKTIHFARWVVLDDARRIIFTSYYDGSLESYMDDFIDKLSMGLNLIFSNGIGYPRTRWLIFGGATDEQAFKDYLRVHQLEVAVFYSAYPDMTTANIINNAAIRRGMAQRQLDDDDARRWLARL